MTMEFRANNVMVGNPMTPAQNVRTTSIAWSVYHSAEIYTQWVSTGVSKGSFTLLDNGNESFLANSYIENNYM